MTALNNEELHNLLSSSPNIIRSRKLRWAGPVAYMEVINAYKMLVRIRFNWLRIGSNGRPL
jgi:hypothetical protein